MGSRALSRVGCTCPVLLARGGEPASQRAQTSCGPSSCKPTATRHVAPSSSSAASACVQLGSPCGGCVGETAPVPSGRLLLRRPARCPRRAARVSVAATGAHPSARRPPLGSGGRLLLLRLGAQPRSRSLALRRRLIAFFGRLRGRRRLGGGGLLLRHRCQQALAAAAAAASASGRARRPGQARAAESLSSSAIARPSPPCASSLCPRTACRDLARGQHDGHGERAAQPPPPASGAPRGGAAPIRGSSPSATGAALRGASHRVRHVGRDPFGALSTSAPLPWGSPPSCPPAARARPARRRRPPPPPALHVAYLGRWPAPCAARGAPPPPPPPERSARPPLGLAAGRLISSGLRLRRRLRRPLRLGLPSANLSSLDARVRARVSSAVAC